MEYRSLAAQLHNKERTLMSLTFDIDVILNTPLTSTDQSEAIEFLASPESLKRIKSLCRRFVRDPVDHEQLAADLWIRSIQQQRELSYTEIRNFCYDALRHRKVQQRAETEKVLTEQQLNLHKEDEFRKVDLAQAVLGDQLTEIMAKTELSWRERMVMYKVYWHDQPMTEIAKEMGMSLNAIKKINSEFVEKLKITVARLGMKMRDE